MEIILKLQSQQIRQLLCSIRNCMISVQLGKNERVAQIGTIIPLFSHVALVKQLGEKHDLPVKSAYNSTRGFHAQMHVNNQDFQVEDLPSQFIKVVKTKNVLAFTTADLVRAQIALLTNYLQKQKISLHVNPSI